MTAERCEFNKAVATRFIEGFNNDDWDAVRGVVAPGFVFHHPVGGTVEAGPEGMVSTWAGFKTLSPDSWHPSPVMIAEGDEVAVLLPTYGTFTGQGEHSPPPTGGRLDYGMVNMVRITDGLLTEMWFGMDSLVEMQQLGVAPAGPTPEMSAAAQANLTAFESTQPSLDGYDTVAGFDGVVVALGPPQADPASTTRRVEVYQLDNGEIERVYEHAMVTQPPFGGDPAADADRTRALVESWIARGLNDHDFDAIGELGSPHLLIHPTAMPCEATHYGSGGAREWLAEQWEAFPDLTIADHHLIAAGDIAAVRWTATGISSGPFMGLEPTGKPVEFTGVSMYRVENGEVVEIWDTRNTLGIISQLNPDLVAHHHHH
jgi:predicted ester cyclase